MQLMKMRRCKLKIPSLSQNTLGYRSGLIFLEESYTLATRKHRREISPWILTENSERERSVRYKYVRNQDNSIIKSLNEGDGGLSPNCCSEGLLPQRLRVSPKEDLTPVALDDLLKLKLEEYLALKSSYKKARAG